MLIISYDAPTFTPFGSIRFGELTLLVQYLPRVVYPNNLSLFI